MQAIILAAGKGTRCVPLTNTQPKVLLPILNKSILEHNLDKLDGIVDEVIIVVGYLADQIKEKIGQKYKKIRITYVEQHKIHGTGGALLLCEKKIRNRFIVLNGDDIYSKKDIVRSIKHKYSVLAKEVDDPKKWGIFSVKNNLVTKLVEKPKKPTSNLANTGLYVLDKSIFNHKLKKTKRNEYEATDYISYLVKKGEKVHCNIVKDYWVPIGYPWHILNAHEFFLDRLKRSIIQGTIEKGVSVKGKVIIGKGTVVKSGAYIEGPVVIGKNCIIGPNCLIRGRTSIGNNCKVGQGVEIKNCVIHDNSAVPHLSYIGDTVIGKNVNVGAGTTTANLRFDHKNIKMNVNKSRIDTGRKKLGAIISDGVQLGIHVNLMPGIRIWPNVFVHPNETVYKDLKK